MILLFALLLRDHPIKFKEILNVKIAIVDVDFLSLLNEGVCGHNILIFLFLCVAFGLLAVVEEF